PRPGDAFPKVAGDTDNARRRNGTLDMQASLSSAMVTLCLTDYLADYPDATVCVHNLGGNIPYEVERMDHRCLLDTPNEELPSSRFRKAKVYVDCNSFGPRAIEAAVRLYGAERIVCGTDGTEFGCDWTRKARAGAAAAIGSSDPGTARSWMLMTRPCWSTNSMSSGISVFFIHIAPIDGTP